MSAAEHLRQAGLALIAAADAMAPAVVTPPPPPPGPPSPPSPPTPPNTIAPSALGAFVHGGAPSSYGVGRWEAFTGLPLRWATIMCGGYKATPRGMRALVQKNLDALADIAPTVRPVFTLPLAFGTRPPGPKATWPAGWTRTGLAATAAGDHDADYRAVAAATKASGRTDIVWRLGWEFTGTWCQWSAVGAATEYAAAFRHVAEVIRAVLPTAQFDWCAMAGRFDQSTYAAAYPGDAYVDIVGLDFYDRGGERSMAPFETVLEFADDHDKLVGVAEWGLDGEDRPAFIELAADWFRDAGDRLAYQNYFNIDNAKGRHVLANFPRSAAAYRAAFGA